MAISTVRENIIELHQSATMPSLGFKYIERLSLQTKTDTSAILGGMDYKVINIQTVLQPKWHWLNCNYGQKFLMSGYKKSTI